MNLITEQTKLTQDAVLHISTVLHEPAWMLQKRVQAFETFEKLPMPEFRYGIAITIDTSSIDFTQMDPHAALLQPIQLAIKAPSSVTVIPFSAAIKEHEKIIQEHFGMIVPSDKKFEAMHYAFLSNALFIIIPKGVEVKEPIMINTEVLGSTSFEHLLVIAEPMSKATIIESATSNVKGYRSKIVEIIVQEGAHVSYANIQHLSETMAHFTTKKARVGKDATMNWLDCSLGASVTLSNVLTDLEQKGARANNVGMFFGDKTQQFDAHYSAVHKAANTTSDMLTKGVLRDKAKAIYRGLIHIQREAPKSVGIQKADTLLLNSGTEADAVPSLEIDNSDVKCNHGSSVGQIDKEKMFYLFSRGLSEEEAMRQVVRGFFEPLAIKIADERLREELRKLIEVKLQ